MDTTLHLPEWMTPREFADELRVTVRTVRIWADSGIIPAHCIRQARATLRIHRDALRYLTPKQETRNDHQQSDEPRG